MAADNVAPRRHASLPKCPTGIAGLDEVTGGGLPRGRPTLVYGGAGCGKTLLAVEFLVRGAMQYDEPGVLMAFEENADELAQNSHSLGFDVKTLIESQKLAVDYVHVERSEIEETGEYDLEGLFVRLGDAIDTLGAKRVVLDTIEVLFSGLSNVGILRSELRRLFRWLKTKGVTAIITGERGEGMTTRYGLEEYVSDCVIALDHRVTEQISTRRSCESSNTADRAHGTNEFPFLIDDDGIGTSCSGSPLPEWIIRPAVTASQRELPHWMVSWRATVTIEAAACSFREQPAAGRPAWRRTLPSARRARGESGASSFSFEESRRPSSFAICNRSASTSDSGSSADF